MLDDFGQWFMLFVETFAYHETLYPNSIQPIDLFCPFPCLPTCLFSAISLSATVSLKGCTYGYGGGGGWGVQSTENEC